MRRLIPAALAALFQVIVACLGLHVPAAWAEAIADSPVVQRGVGEEWVSLADGYQPGSPPVLTIVESTPDRTVLHLALPGYWAASCLVNGAEYQTLTIPDATFTAEVGRARLPVVHALLAVPCNARPTVTVRSANESERPGCRVYPCQPPVFDGVTAPTAPVMDCAPGQDMNAAETTGQRAGDQDATLYPAEVVCVSPPGVWRDLNVVRLDICPMRYDEAAHMLHVSNGMTIEVLHSSGDGTVERAGHAASAEFDAMYGWQVLNYAAAQQPTTRDATREGPQYVIITHPDFETAIEPLARWRQRTGLVTEIVPIATTNSQVIKDAIVSRYNEGQLEYVLLVGDPGYVPIANWGGLASDYWYSCITGTTPDLYADVALGRLSVTTSEQVEHQVAKTLDYLTDPPLDSPWLTQTLFVSHMAGGAYEYRACKEYIRTSIIPGTAFTASTAYGDTAGVDNALVTARINAGQGIVNYRGHGLTSSWWQWDLTAEDWTTTNVYALANGDCTPVVFNVACENHRIQDTAESLGEAWMNKYPGGAVASLGATDDGITYPNQNYDKQLFDQFCHRGEYHLGWISNAAATYILTHDPAYAPWNVKMFLWLGDPAVEIWTSVPGSMAVAHAEAVRVGESQFAVSVSAGGAPVSKALVCLWKDGEVFQTRETADGEAAFSIVPASTGTLAVTVTKHDYLPYQADVPVLDFLLADINGDGLVNVFDIDPFVVALTLDEAEFAGQHPDWHYWTADCNRDGAVNTFDIDPFVLMLTGG